MPMHDTCTPVLPSARLGTCVEACTISDKTGSQHVYEVAGSPLYHWISLVTRATFACDAVLSKHEPPTAATVKQRCNLRCTAGQRVWQPMSGQSCQRGHFCTERYTFFGRGESACYAMSWDGSLGRTL